MIRRYGNAPVSGQKYKARHGAYAVLPRNGQLLVTWQGGIHNEVQLPGGGIDPGESAVAALHREVFEETGWHITAPRRLGAFRRFVEMPEYGGFYEKICHVYVATPTLRIGPPVEDEHEPLWMSPAQAIRVLANDGDADFVAGVLT